MVSFTHVARVNDTCLFPCGTCIIYTPHTKFFTFFPLYPMTKFVYIPQGICNICTSHVKRVSVTRSMWDAKQITAAQI